MFKNNTGPLLKDSGIHQKLTNCFEAVVKLISATWDRTGPPTSLPVLQYCLEKHSTTHTPTV